LTDSKLHEEQYIDLSWYPIESSKMTSAVAYMYYLISIRVPEIRSMRLKQDLHHIVAIHGWTQVGKTMVAQMAAIMYSIAFSAISLLSVQNNDGSSVSEKHKKDFTYNSNGIEQSRILEFLLECIDKTAIELKLSHVSKFELSGLFVRNIQCISDLNQVQRWNGPIILTLNSNSTLPRIVTGSDWFQGSIMEIKSHGKVYKRLIIIGDENDLNVVSASRDSGVFEQSFFHKEFTELNIYGSESKSTLFNRACMNVTISATNMATLMYSENSDIQPLVSSCVMRIPQNYHGFMNDGIQCNVLDLDPIQGVLSVLRQRQSNHYVSCLVNTAKCRKENKFQTEIAQEIAESMQNIQYFFIFTYNGGILERKNNQKNIVMFVPENIGHFLVELLPKGHAIGTRHKSNMTKLEFTSSNVNEIYSAIWNFCQQFEIIKPIIVCVSGKLASRGTSFKTLDHKYPLTDLYYQTSQCTFHYEQILQDIGRLSSIDDETIDRIIHVNSNDRSRINEAIRYYYTAYKFFENHQQLNTPMILKDIFTKCKPTLDQIPLEQLTEFIEKYSNTSQNVKITRDKVSKPTAEMISSCISQHVNIKQNDNVLNLDNIDELPVCHETAVLRALIQVSFSGTRSDIFDTLESNGNIVKFTDIKPVIHDNQNFVCREAEELDINNRISYVLKHSKYIHKGSRSNREYTYHLRINN
jgi:hypothetical protein